MGCYIDGNDNRLEPEDYPGLYFFGNGNQAGSSNVDPECELEKARRLAEATGDYSELDRIFGFC